MKNHQLGLILNTDNFLTASAGQVVANPRHNFLRWVSKTLVKNHASVVAEELRSKSLLRNRALVLSIADVGWRNLLSMGLFYWCQFIIIAPRNTTQICSHCGLAMSTDKIEKTLSGCDERVSNVLVSTFVKSCI